MFAERVAEYKRLQQNNIRLNNSILNKTYGKAKFETQVVTGTATLSDLTEAPISQSNYKNSLEFSIPKGVEKFNVMLRSLHES